MRTTTTHESKMEIEDNNYNIRHRRLSAEHKSKISIARTGQKHSKSTKKKIGKNNGMSNLGKRLSESTKRKISLSKCKNIDNWNGYITPVNKRIRLSKEWRIWRETIFERDNYTCQNKNCTFCNNKKGVTLHPHHIKQFSTHTKDRFKVNNGITYCENFHLKSGLHKNIGAEKNCNER